MKQLYFYFAVFVLFIFALFCCSVFGDLLKILHCQHEVSSSV